DEFAHIMIKDNGPGIPLDIQNKLFDPFFTTKPVGKGTGLGLSICYKIIEKHQGEIKLISEPGKGAEFIIALPVSRESRGKE
ncbi:MAG: ATP-binding protein, partial [Calothrix sp. MO_167.B12]|nr:ATP-binding protein [Calothrix sp. MO_167.B12]